MIAIKITADNQKMSFKPSIEAVNRYKTPHGPRERLIKCSIISNDCIAQIVRHFN
ncbi:hypothetical protein HDG33_003177 [Paraburkholderia sp. Cpub6]|nr:hypothetical protein [Paraburkholderia sp. Cpub6]